MNIIPICIRIWHCQSNPLIKKNVLILYIVIILDSERRWIITKTYQSFKVINWLNIQRYYQYIRESQDGNKIITSHASSNDDIFLNNDRSKFLVVQSFFCAVWSYLVYGFNINIILYIVYYSVLETWKLHCVFVVFLVVMYSYAFSLFVAV